MTPAEAEDALRKVQVMLDTAVQSIA